MFEVKRVTDHRLEIICNGKLDAEKMKQGLNALVEQSDGIENGTMQFDILSTPCPHSVPSESSSRALIPGLHIKAFTLVQRVEAEAWLNATTG